MSHGELTSRAIVGGLRARLRKVYAGTPQAAEVETGDLATLRRLSRAHRAARRAGQVPGKLRRGWEQRYPSAWLLELNALNPVQSVYSTLRGLGHLLPFPVLNRPDTAALSQIAAVGHQDPRTSSRNIGFLVDKGFLLKRRRFDHNGAPIENEYLWIKPPGCRTAEEQKAIEALSDAWRAEVHLSPTGPLVEALAAAAERAEGAPAADAAELPPVPSGPLEGLSEAERGRVIADLFRYWWQDCLQRGKVPPHRPSRKERALLADYLDDAGSIERCKHAIELVTAKVIEGRWQHGIQWLGGTRPMWPSAVERMRLREDGPAPTWEELLHRVEPLEALARLLSGHDPVTEEPIGSWEGWWDTWGSVEPLGWKTDAGSPFALTTEQREGIERHYGRTPDPVETAARVTAAEADAAAVELRGLVAALRALAPVTGSKWSPEAAERKTIEALAVELQSQAKHATGAGREQEDVVADFCRGVADLRARLHPERGRE